MTDETALLRAVCSHPDDDTPRLVYADWLEEQGEPRRAAFIRAQISGLRDKPAATGIARRVVQPTGSPPLTFPRLLAYRPWEDAEVAAAVADHPAFVECRSFYGRAVVLWRRGFVEAVGVGSGRAIQAARDALGAAPLREVGFPFGNEAYFAEVLSAVFGADRAKLLTVTIAGRLRLRVANPTGLNIPPLNGMTLEEWLAMNAPPLAPLPVGRQL